MTGLFLGKCPARSIDQALGAEHRRRRRSERMTAGLVALARRKLSPPEFQAFLVRHFGPSGGRRGQEYLRADRRSNRRVAAPACTRAPPG